MSPSQPSGTSAIARQIWLLSAIFALLSALLMRSMPSTSLLTSSLSGYRLLGLAAGIILCVAVSELLVTDMVAQTGSHSFSVSDLPLVAAVLLLPPRLSVATMTIGLGAILKFYRNLPSLRLVFNVAQTMLSVSVGIVVARWALDSSGMETTKTWATAILAVLVSSAVGSIAVDVAVTICDGNTHMSEMGLALAYALASALASASLGVLVIWAARVDWTVLVLVVPPIGVTFNAIRSAMQQQQRRKDLEFLYAALTAMNDSRGMESALASVSRSLSDSLRADDVKIRLHTTEGWLVVKDNPVGLEQSPLDSPLPIQAKHCESSPSEGVLRRRIDGQEGTLALIEVRDKRAGRKGFDAHDGQLLDRLADQLGVHLENSGLARSLSQLVVAEQRLREQLETDTLTGLFNRTWLGALCTQQTPSAVVLIDLDGFKQVNDTRGHEEGDRVLKVCARQLELIAPQGWVPMRLGGDEFGMIRVLQSAVTKEEMEGLIDSIEMFAVPAELARSLGVPVGASAGGAARTRVLDDIDELMRRADTAMYAAKRARKSGANRPQRLQVVAHSAVR